MPHIEINGTRLHYEIEGTGHMTPAEQPDLVNEMLRRLAWPITGSQGMAGRPASARQQQAREARRPSQRFQGRKAGLAVPHASSLRTGSMPEQAGKSLDTQAGSCLKCPP
jgi:hypothetical protein